MDKWGGVVKAQAALQQKQTDAGEKIIPSLINLQKGTTDLAVAFSNLAAGPLLKVTQGFAKFAENVEKKGLIEAIVGNPLDAIKEAIERAKQERGVDG
jgi:hypothetical protein